MRNSKEVGVDEAIPNEIHASSFHQVLSGIWGAVSQSKGDPLGSCANADMENMAKKEIINVYA